MTIEEDIDSRLRGNEKGNEFTPSAIVERASKPQNRLDFALACLLALANLAVLSVCWKIQGIQADESTYIYGALEMIKGSLIYRDFWVFYPPGIFFLAIAAFGLLGKSLFALRLTLILEAAVTTAALYLLGRRCVPRFASISACILFIALGVDLWPVFGHHWNSTFALVFSVYFMARFLEDERHRFLMGSGLFVGITLLFQLHKGIPLAAGALFILLVRSLARNGLHVPALKDSVKVTCVFLISCAIPVGLVVMYLAEIGVLKEAFAAVMVFPFRQMAGAAAPDYGTPYGAYSVGVLSSLMRFLNLTAITKTSVLVVAVLIAVAVPFSAIAVFFITLPQLKRFQQVKHLIPCLVSISALACFVASVSRPDFHHLLTAAPLGYLTVIIMATLPFTNGSGGARRRWRKIVHGIVFLVLLPPAAWVGAGALLYGSHVRTLYVGSPLGFAAIPVNGGFSPATSTAFESVIAFIKANTAEGEKIFVMPSSPFIYYLADRPNATRFSMLMSSMRDREQMKEIIGDLERNKTRWIVLDPAASWEQFKIALPYADEEEFRENVLLQYIGKNYKKVGDYGGFALMERVGEPPVR
ncbi:MAG: glycosyltransferase family 39 protein [Candidatus Lindowbacteria bacterium]|nr:glycosyltransferase family 39 protein [Candidatus Lindowbacteria bacterium]